MSARKIEEIRVPVPMPPGSVMALADGAPPPIKPTLEYLVVERWSDGTIRHPTTGVQVVEELWERDREGALYVLRTQGWT